VHSLSTLANGVDWYEWEGWWRAEPVEVSDVIGFFFNTLPSESMTINQDEALNTH